MGTLPTIGAVHVTPQYDPPMLRAATERAVVGGICCCTFKAIRTLALVAQEVAAALAAQRPFHLFLKPAIKRRTFLCGWHHKNE